MAPSYLRTKPEPGVEEKMAQLITRSSQLSQDAFQVNTNHRYLCHYFGVGYTFVCLLVQQLKSDGWIFLQFGP